jgi:uncharacterized protein (TIGR00369 family)
VENLGIDTVPSNPDFEAVVRESFARQSMMQTLGASLAKVAPGLVEIDLEAAPHILQQHGLVHAGAVASVADSACGYASLTLMPPGVGVLSIEFKINLMAPARGRAFRARAKVIKRGRTVSVCMAEVVCTDHGQEKAIAMMTASMMTVAGRPDIKG